MTISPTPGQARARRLAPALGFPLLAVAACTNDEDPQFPVGETEFSALMTEAAEVPAPVGGTLVRVTLINRAPALGTLQTPVWVGFHDGTFDLFNLGANASAFFPVSGALERLAEDGTTEALQTEFADSGAGVRDGVLGGVLTPGPLEPGESVSMVFELDPSLASSRYFSYASMVLPSNDAFVANDDPMAHEIIDAGGAFAGSSILVTGADVLDAGTEQNDELLANTAFFGQATPDTGLDEFGVVALHPGFLVPNAGNPAITILEDPQYAEADFLQPGYEVLEIRFEEVVAPAAPAFGAAFAEVDSVGGQLEIELEASGLSGPPVAANVHRASAGASGPIVFSLTGAIEDLGDGALRIDGDFPVSADTVQALRDGELYVSIRTDLNPAGELRGQFGSEETYAADLSAGQAVPAPIDGDRLRVVATNRAPALGTYQTPVWVGFHDGTFDAFDTGSAASSELERLAEDGTVDDLDTAFLGAATGGRSLVLPGAFTPGPLQPGETATAIVTLDGSSAATRYLSYGSMVIPSNDAFIANDDPLAIELFNGSGVLNSVDVFVDGSEVLDAGTEVNDELPANTAFFGQAAANTGVAEGSTIGAHPGFLAPNGGDPAVTILEDPEFAGADFTAIGYENLRLRVLPLADAGPRIGQLTLRLNATEDQATLVIQAENLSGEVVSLQLRQGLAGANGPVLVDLTDLIVLNANGALSATGDKAVNGAFVTALEAGEVYVDIDTGLNPTGEIRGQLSVED